MMFQNFILIASALLGFSGTALAVVAYIPQIYHLAKERNARGVSFQTYLWWGISSAFLTIHAVILRDPPFIFLQIANFVFIFIILVLIKKFKTSV